MGRSGANRLGAIPNASGALTRLAYAHLKSSGIEPQALLKQANFDASANQKCEHTA